MLFFYEFTVGNGVIFILKQPLRIHILSEKEKHPVKHNLCNSRSLWKRTFQHAAQENSPWNKVPLWLIIIARRDMWRTLPMDRDKAPSTVNTFSSREKKPSTSSRTLTRRKKKHICFNICFMGIPRNFSLACLYLIAALPILVIINLINIPVSRS